MTAPSANRPESNRIPHSDSVGIEVTVATEMVEPAAMGVFGVVS